MRRRLEQEKSIIMKAEKMNNFILVLDYHFARFNDYMTKNDETYTNKKDVTNKVG